MVFRAVYTDSARLSENGLGQRGTVPFCSEDYKKGDSPRPFSTVDPKVSILHLACLFHASLFP
jgi:hypothetical protein